MRKNTTSTERNLLITCHTGIILRVTINKSCMLKHFNVGSEQPWIVLEYLENGNLSEFLMVSKSTKLEFLHNKIEVAPSKFVVIMN